MKLAARLTLDGLIRALRTKKHRLDSRTQATGTRLRRRKQRLSRPEAKETAR